MQSYNFLTGLYFIFQSGLEKEIDEAVAAGDVDKAEELSNYLASRNFAVRVSEAANARDYAKRKKVRLYPGVFLHLHVGNSKIASRIKQLDKATYTKNNRISLASSFRCSSPPPPPYFLAI